jgi:serine/threonine protein kinase/WD40 repeat protein
MASDGNASDRSAGSPEDLDRDLTALDDRLRSGTTPPAAASPGAVTVESSGEEFLKLKACVELLDRAWPRNAAASRPADLPARIGRFEIEKVLGYGGFGIVYLAHDPLLQRQVALKVPRLHSLVDENLRERFHREARAAAALDHPNIVPIHDTGSDGGVWFLASAYCPGPNLGEWLKAQPSPVCPRLAARLLADLAGAVHYSHTQGVLHRDLKPENVILAPQPPGTPGGEDLPFVPRLTDFGLARLLGDNARETAASLILGTPLYMSPEQITGAHDEIGPGTDVYSLGVMLYALLVGRPPFQSESIADILEQARCSDPVPLRRLRRDIPRDLETICLKCLEKSPADRYPSARDLYDDLERFLRGEPIQACPPQWWNIAIKWGQRRPLAAALAALAAAVVIAGPAVLISHNRQLSSLTASLSNSLRETQDWQKEAESHQKSAEAAARAAEGERDAADAARQKADRHSRELAKLTYASSVRLADQAFRNGDIRQCRAHLETAFRQTTAERPPGLEWNFLDYQTRATHRNLGTPLEYFTSVAFAPAGGLVAAGGTAGYVQLIDVSTGAVRTLLSTPHLVVRAVAFDRRGDRLAVGGDDGTISIWNVGTGALVSRSPWRMDGLAGLAWAGDDAWIAAAGGPAGVRLWKIDSEEESLELEMHPAIATCIAASHDGRLLAVGDHDGSVRLCEYPGWTSRPLIDDRGGTKITALAFTHAGGHLAIGDNNAVVTVYRLSGEKPSAVFSLHRRDDMRSLAFSPRDDRLVLLEKFGTIEVFTLTPGKSAKLAPRYQHGWLAHEDRGTQVACSPDGKQIVSVGRGSDRPRLWSSSARPAVIALPLDAVDGGDLCELAFTPESGRLILAGPQVACWSFRPPKLDCTLGTAPSRYDRIAVSNDGRWMAAENQALKAVELWNLGCSSTTPEWSLADQRADRLFFSPNGNELAIVDWRNDRVVVVDRHDGQRLHALPARQCHDAAYSPEGRFLATDDRDDVVVWEVGSWSAAYRLRGHLSTIRSLAFSGDGRWLASAGDDREVRLWRVADWTWERTLTGQRRELRYLQFTPDSRSLLVRDLDENITVWHVATGLEMCLLSNAANGRAAQFALSPNGAWLAVRREDGRVEVRKVRDE